MVGLTSEDPTKVNIYQAVCAKKCPTLTPSSFTFPDALFEFEVMATTNFTYNIGTATGEGKVQLSAKDKTDIMTILSVNSTSKHFTCLPNIAAEYVEDSQKIIDALMGQINVGFGSYI